MILGPLCKKLHPSVTLKKCSDNDNNILTSYHLSNLCCVALYYLYGLLSMFDIVFHPEHQMVVSG